MSCKTAYVCGPLTELPAEIRDGVKRFYEQIARVYYSVFGQEAFVPHMYFDPIKNATATPREVDCAERRQVCEKTSIVIVVAIAPSWGGGIEVEMARNSDVPVMVLFPKGKKVSRLLLGNPAVQDIICYENERYALSALQHRLEFLQRISLVAV